MNENSAKAGLEKKRRPTSGRRRFPIWLAAVLLLAGSLWGIPWWNERPLRQAESLLNNNDPEAAFKVVEAFLKTDSANSRAVALKARALVGLGQAAEALRLIERVGAASVEEMRAYADASLILQKWSQALPVLEYLNQQTPGDSDLLHELSACRAKLGLYEKAVAAAEEFAALDGNAARGYMLIGMLERDRGNNQKCCDAWKRVLAERPDADGLQVPPEEFFLEYGKAMMLSGLTAEAAPMLLKSLAIKPQADAYSFLGKSLSQQGKRTEAEQAWTKALELSASIRLAREGLAELAMQKREFAQAAAWLKPLEDQADLKSTTGFLLHRIATLLNDTEKAQYWKERTEQLRRQEEVRVNMEQVIVNSPDSLWARVFQAYHLAEQNNPDQAKTVLFPFVKEDAHPFILSLWMSLQNGAALPSLDQVPLESF
jgi:tetratricopeptide (TPR) repeat protein